MDDLRHARDREVPEILDYRRWFDYVLQVTSRSEGGPSDLARHRLRFGSGGEQAVPEKLDPSEIGRRIGESVRGMKSGKMAEISRQVSAQNLSQTDAAAAADAAVKALGLRTSPTVRLDDGRLVIPSVVLGEHQPVLIVGHKGNVYPGTATIGFDISSKKP